MLAAHLPGGNKTLKSGWPVSEAKLEAGTSQIRSINADDSSMAFCDVTKENRNTPPVHFRSINNRSAV